MKRIPEGHALVRISDLADLHRRANLPRPRARLVLKGENSGLVYMDVSVDLADTLTIPALGAGDERFRLQVVIQ